MGMFSKLAMVINAEKKRRKEEEEKKEKEKVTRKIVEAITQKETENHLLQCFEMYLRSLFTYKVSLKKYQYLLWDEEKIQGKISNHILIFGFHPGVTHFIKATR